jgi:hypothetical protein
MFQLKLYILKRYMFFVCMIGLFFRYFVEFNFNIENGDEYNKLTFD